ncbi:LytTR family transcriptional regulator DNA-binding domain-containing protein [Paenibacillus silvisoli]|uniref:LytTR family transcriptional regulator DNA-binding domain-containing protein n=1 Tax=Paenibacillus silvisoli TaxID=3110539 RepID=UPI002805D442|nr:LytTR family transcriptional regulator DNA-binding domain-containing protein [Paenibacillus silvisoli]
MQRRCEYLAVSRDIDGKSGLVSVLISDVLLLYFDGVYDRLIIHTMQDQYYTMGSLKYWTEALNSSGYAFRIVDRNNAANLDNVAFIDSASKKVYFEQVTHPKSKYCTISDQQFKKLKAEYGDGQLLFVKR